MGAVCCKGEELDFSNQVELFHFYLLRVIGKGAFGKVHLVQHKGTLLEYALKCIHKDKCVELRAANNMISERRLLERINYPLIVNLRYAFQDDDHLFMVLDLMLGGDLRFQLERNGPLSELQVRFYVAEIALSLAYLHRRRIAHRDLKPDNILLDEDGHAHLSDFNIATQFNDKRPLRWSKAGSLAYMAPETLDKRGYSTSVDWWSLGIMAYELLFGKRPFAGSTSDDVVEAILNDPLTFPEDAQQHVSEECLDLISKLLNRSPFERLGCGPGGFDQFKAHPWFQGLQWDQLENKEATPPFTPSKKESNFDAVHELEELLLDGEPLRPRKRASKSTFSDADTLSEAARARQYLEEKFLPFDCTKQESWGQYRHHHHDSIEAETNSAVRGVVTAAAAATTTTTAGDESRLLRRIGGVLNEHIDNAKYRGQGYMPAPVEMDESDDASITRLSTKALVDKTV
ncbi:camp-dependent protein kinase [Lichtheimia corymbifera JMRC:FSU:9682]|uniref:Camp-dependent protein kinase n=1 Tax=Lichtheimia corymbifera JMRC:FSU:9682 TaxID=1263082 RepID=A0A068S7L1_9FUNG|nr:camp-dependent protein kinase [Lichtheimia corymbifera JMRC:FSU:9682]